MSWDGGRSGSGAVIIGFRNGNRIVRVSPDTIPNSYISFILTFSPAVDVQKQGKQVL